MLSRSVQEIWYIFFFHFYNVDISIQNYWNYFPNPIMIVSSCFSELFSSLNRFASDTGLLPDSSLVVSVSTECHVVQLISEMCWSRRLPHIDASHIPQCKVPLSMTAATNLQLIVHKYLTQLMQEGVHHLLLIYSSHSFGKLNVFSKTEKKWLLS